MKNTVKLCLIMAIFMIIGLSLSMASSDNEYPIELTNEENEWLKENRGRTFILGLDPYAGKEYFIHNGEEKGYILDLIKSLEKDLGIDIELESNKSWGEVYSGLKTGEVDILFGANETDERKKFMAFTKAIHKYPYALLSKKDSSIRTIGDIDGKNIGLMEGDIVLKIFPQVYKNINYTGKIYNDQNECVDALINNEIDAFIVSGGSVVYELIYEYHQLEYVSNINTITSDMTLSTRKEDEILVKILDKEIQYLSTHYLPEVIGKATIDYNKEIMNLSEAELKWLEEDGVAYIGIADDYLPFEYYEDGEYKGISGQIIKEISNIIGIEFKNKPDTFSQLLEYAQTGEIDVLNIAKTEERLKYFIYPRPYSTERDIIIGRRESEEAVDIYGLEGKKVAVIKGFWHKEHLLKNLVHINVIETDNIQESLKLVDSGKADYLIENPTVARFYIDGLKLYNLVEKGSTSTDSYLYFGITKTKPYLASIIDKVIPLLDIEELKRRGYDEVPHISDDSSNEYFISLIVLLLILLLIIVLYVMKLIRELIDEKAKSEVLKQRENLLFLDALTQVYNSNYYFTKLYKSLDEKNYPQTIIWADMNNLKLVNDNYGHFLGDELLKTFANTLREVCPEYCYIIRMGGDEFLIIIEGKDGGEARDIIERIRIINGKKNIRFNEEILVRPSAAFGYATRYSSETSLDELIKEADKKMYEDKRKQKESSDGKLN